MATSKKSTGKKSKDPMSSVGVTHVNLSVRQVSGEVKKIRGICGHGLEQPLANYDPDTQSWKMYGDISLWGDCPLLVNLPVSGMTQSGVLFLQHPWEPITGEIESLSWPTPTAVTRPMEGNVRMYRAKIEAGEMTEAEAEAILGKSVWAAQGAIPIMWPTPTARDHKGAAGWKNPNRNLADLTYLAQIKDGHRMWPTPTTQEVEHPEAELTETGRRKSKNGNTSHSLGLADAVQMWPTPTASDWKGRGPNSKQQGLSEVVKYPTPTYGKLAGGTGGFNQIEDLYLTGQVTLEKKKAMQAGNGGRLNPTWVEWLMGFPTGWTDLED
jgi:DNA (cytosine-5)-methyltransferase 1